MAMKFYTKPLIAFGGSLVWRGEVGYGRVPLGGNKGGEVWD